MSQELPQNQISEEINVIGLFNYFGKVIKKGFNFLLQVLKNILFYFVKALVFLRENIKFLGIPTLLALAIGFGLELFTPVKYKYDALIKPNYGAENQITEFIENLQNNLIEKDSISVAEILSISVSDAAKLYDVDIKPYGTELDKVVLYDKYVRKLDTTSRQILTYDKFLNSTQLLSDRFIFRVYALDNQVKLNIDSILKKVTTNYMLNFKRKLRLQSFEAEEEIIRKSLNEIDSLRIFSKEILLKEINKKEEKAVTNINLAPNNQNNQDVQIKLFDITKSLSKSLVHNIISKAENEEIIEVLTDFNDVGTIFKKTFFEKMTTILPLYVFLALLSFLLLKKLNVFLDNFSRRNN